MKRFAEQTAPPVAMILAAGRGSRMGNLTNETPKPLLPLNDETIIEFIIKKLQRVGIRQIVINLHYLGEKIRSHLGNGEHLGVHIVYSEEEVLLNTGGGIARARPLFDDHPVLVVNSDVLTDLSPIQFFEYFQQSRALASMALVPSRDFQNYALVLYDEEMRLKGFLLKGQEPPPGVNTGIFTGYQIISPEAYRYLTVKPYSIIEMLYQRLLSEGMPVSVYLHNGQWLDLGEERYYQVFREKLLRKEINLNKFLNG